MVPRLVAIAGPRKGEVFPLTGEDLSIGRDASNGLRIRDRSVSRLHCVLNFEGGQYRIRDLESRNGVFVNDIPVREKALVDGDQIKIGTALFLFLLHEVEPAGEATLVEFEDASLGTEPTAQLRYEEARYLRPDELLASLPIAGQMARD